MKYEMEDVLFGLRQPGCTVHPIRIPGRWSGLLHKPPLSFDALNYS